MVQVVERATVPTTRKQVGMAALLLGIVTAIAVLGSLATIPNTNGWYLEVAKVPWNPPNSVFGPAWSVLYLLIALAGFLIWRTGYAGAGKENAAKDVLWVYAVQLGLNSIWTPIFFAGYPVVGKPAWWVGLVVILPLVAVVVWLGVRAAQFSRVAAWIQVPYAAWLLFATSLNAGIIILN